MIHRHKVVDLVNVLNDENVRAEATEIISGLVDKVVLTPSTGRTNLDVQLRGDLAAILEICDNFNPNAERHGSIKPRRKLSVVAGAGFGPFHNSPKMVVNF